MNGVASVGAGAWTTADYALIISLFSACLSLLGLGWNIWSKFIFPKPRIEIKVTWVMTVGGSPEFERSAISITAVNHGPIDVSLTGIVAVVKAKTVFGKKQRAIFPVFDNWPNDSATTTGGRNLPKRLPVGEQFSVYVPEKSRGYEDFLTLGFTDGFGREHFAKSNFQRQFLKHTTLTSVAP
jgi:hypothetical protein